MCRPVFLLLLDGLSSMVPGGLRALGGCPGGGGGQKVSRLDPRSHRRETLGVFYCKIWLTYLGYPKPTSLKILLFKDTRLQSYTGRREVQVSLSQSVRMSFVDYHRSVHVDYKVQLFFQP